MWAEKYSGSLEDVFDIQERVSRAIVKALHVTLSPDEDCRVAERPIEDVRAYECYLRARHEIYRFTQEGLDRALALLRQGLEIVGDNALLYGTLGAAYCSTSMPASGQSSIICTRPKNVSSRCFGWSPTPRLATTYADSSG